MKTEEKKEEVLLPSLTSLTIEQVPEMIAVIDKQLRAISNPPEASMTDGMIDGKNIFKMENVEELFALHILIEESAEAYNKKAEKLIKKLGLTKVPKTWKKGKWGADAWLNTIEARITEITQADKIKRLKKYKEKLSKFVTEEQQLQAILAEIKDDVTPQD